MVKISRIVQGKVRHDKMKIEPVYTYLAKA